MSKTGALMIELPPQRTQTAFNLQRWAELQREPALAKIEDRIETDRHSQILLDCGSDDVARGR